MELSTIFADQSQNYSLLSYSEINKSRCVFSRTRMASEMEPTTDLSEPPKLCDKGKVASSKNAYI